MMLLSQAARALGGQLIGPDVEFRAVSTDSRGVAAGDLFIALRGEHFDGYEFAASAIKDGAAAAMVNADSYRVRPPALSPQSPVLLVPDTRLALGQLAAHWRAQFNLPVVALTGSNGKTTVKEMLASILREAAGSEEAVLATQGNLNNDIGMPLTLLKLRAGHQYAVIEMGMNHPGEIACLTRIARPDIAIVNNASGAHLAGLGTVEAVARAKGEIFTGLKAEGVAVINADDAYAPLWRELAAAHRVMDFALERQAEVHGCWQSAVYGAQLDVDTRAGSFAVRLQVPGVHNARNALAATAAAAALGISLSAIAAGLEKFSGVAGRMQRKTAAHGALLIDDTYNANPASMRAALEVLAHLSGKRVFVMGDMGELGADAPRLHAEIGALARGLGIPRLLALGELSREAVREFGAGARHFACIEDLLAVLDEELDAGTTVLVKGSRFMRMERVVAHCVDEGTRERTREKVGVAAPGISPSLLPPSHVLSEKERKCCSH